MRLLLPLLKTRINHGREAGEMAETLQCGQLKEEWQAKWKMCRLSKFWKS
jgi:hypothetical protein